MYQKKRYILKERICIKRNEPKEVNFKHFSYKQEASFLPLKKDS